jgi:hypothetical protein
MNLGGEIREVELTSVQVKSNEPERRLVNGAVQADVSTLHEPHVGVEQQRLDATVRIPGGSGSLHVCDPDKALKSVIDDGSIPGPKKVVWNVIPLRVKVAGVDLGGGTETIAPMRRQATAARCPARHQPQPPPRRR